MDGRLANNDAKPKESVFWFKYCDYSVPARNGIDDARLRFVVSIYAIENDVTAVRAYDFVSRPSPNDGFKTLVFHDFELSAPAESKGKRYAVAMIVMSPILNDHGKRCWRNLGTAIVESRPGERAVDDGTAFHVVFNNSCGIPKKHRVSGIFSFNSNVRLRRRSSVDSPEGKDATRRTVAKRPKTMTRENDSFETYFDALKQKLESTNYDNVVPLLAHLNATYAPSDYYWCVTESNAARLNDVDGDGLKFQTANVPLFDLNLHGGKSSNPQRDEIALNQLKLSITNALVNDKHTRLPFYSVLYRKKPKVTVSYWLNALDLLAKYHHRTQNVGSFCRDFSDRFELGRKAAYAAHLLTLYCQHLEYISDYDVSVAGENITQDRMIEQFSSALVNMCGDCEDSNTGIYQTWKSFRKFDFDLDDASVDRIFENDRRWDLQTLKDMLSVLKTAQRVLVENYTAFVCSDVINTHAKPSFKKGESLCDGYEPYVGAKSAKSYHEYVSKDYAGAETKRYDRPHCDKRYRMDGSDIVRETLANADSAHICVKMIPNASLSKWMTAPPSPPTGDATLPVLFLEATSFLFPSDEEICKNEVCIVTSNAKETINVQRLFTKGRPVVADCTRIPYVFEKGYSNFYKGTAFLVTDAFKSENAFTFIALSESSSAGSLFRGISHGQLSYKSNALKFVPYASLFENGKESTPVLETACRMQRRFDYEKNIDAATVVAKPKTKSEFVRYNHLMHDSNFDFDRQSETIRAFLDKCRLLLPRKDDEIVKNERINDANTMGEREYYEKWCDLNVFMDPKYVSDERVLFSELYDAFETILGSSRCAFGLKKPSKRFDFDVQITNAYLEYRFDLLSYDLGYWVVCFHFKKK